MAEGQPTCGTCALSQSSCSLRAGAPPCPAPLAALNILFNNILFHNILTAPAAGAVPWQAVEDLDKRVAPLREKDPKAALAELKRFAQENPDADPWIDVLVARWEVNLLTGSLNDNAAALALCDEMVKKHDKVPAGMSPIADKARLLVATAKPAEAEALIEKYWDLVPVTHRDYSNAALVYYCDAAQAEAKPEKAVAMLQKALVQVPVFLDEGAQSPQGWMYDRLVKALIAADKAVTAPAAMDEALSWAKLRFIECAFDAAAIERSTRALIGVWTAKELSQRTANAFAEAQKDPEKPNPLAAVKLPALDAEALKALEVRTYGENGPQALHGRVGVRILAGALREAMVEARQALIDDPESPAGTQEICRILKAADCGVRRANAFIEFVKGGAGENPLEGFFKEHPAGK